MTAMRSGRAREPRVVAHLHEPVCASCCHRPWEALTSASGVRVAGVTLCPSEVQARHLPFRLHCLIKLLDRHGHDMGQGVVPIGTAAHAFIRAPLFLRQGGGST